MKFTATYSVPAPREKVFALLTDPAVLQRCIPGCEKIERTKEDHYDAHLKIGGAGFKGSHIGQVEIQDKHSPESYKLLLEGKGGGGFIKSSAHIHLADRGAQTEIRCDAETQVGGMIAWLGSRLVEATGKKTIDEFFKNFADEVAKQG